MAKKRKKPETWTTSKPEARRLLAIRNIVALLLRHRIIKSRDFRVARLQLLLTYPKEVDPPLPKKEISRLEKEIDLLATEYSHI